MKRIALVLIVLAVAPFVQAQSMPATAPAKLPVPSEKDVTDAKKIIKDRLKKEYAALMAVQGKDIRQQYAASGPICNGLWGFAAPQNEPATRYAAQLLVIEVSLLEPVSESQMYFLGLIPLGHQFDLSGDAYGKLVVDSFTKLCPRSQYCGTVAFLALLATEEMTEREQFEAARTLAQIALKAAQFGIKVTKADPKAIKYRDNAAKEASLLLSNIKEMEAACKKVQPFLETLKTTPDDEAANTEVGSFLCYFKRDWKTGLAKMFLGKDQATKTIAADDIKATTAVEKITVAHKWLEMAAKSKGVAKSAMEEHYRNLYHAACSALADGEKLKVDAKLDGGPQFQANMRRLVLGRWNFSDGAANNVWFLADDGTAKRGGPNPSGTWSVDADTATLRFGDTSFRFQLPIDPNGTIIEDDNGRFCGLAYKE